MTNDTIVWKEEEEEEVHVMFRWLWCIIVVAYIYTIFGGASEKERLVSLFSTMGNKEISEQQDGIVQKRFTPVDNSRMVTNKNR